MKISLSSITSGATRTVTVPDSDLTIVGTSTSQTLTNKTLTTPIISAISNTGTLTLPTATDTLVGRATTDVLTNKSLTTNSVNFVDSSAPTKILAISTSGATGGFTTTIASVGTANRTLTLPDSTDVLVGANTQVNLTNKNFVDDSIYFVDDIDFTKRMTIELPGATTGTTTTLYFNQTANRDITFPDVTDTLVAVAATQTLTNKTLTSPIISSISNTGTLTLPTTTDTLVGRATTDTLTNKTIISTTNNVMANRLCVSGGFVDISGITAPTAGQVLTATSSSTAVWQSNQRWILRDEKTIGTVGGSFAAGSWVVRSLNTMTYNGGSNCTLSSNQFTLQAGIYLIKGISVANNVGVHQIRIYNVSTSTPESFGIASKPSGRDCTSSEVECVVSPGSATIYRLEHRCTISNTTDGLGSAAGFGTEVYSSVTVTKL